MLNVGVMAASSAVAVNHWTNMGKGIYMDKPFANAVKPSFTIAKYEYLMCKAQTWSGNCLLA